MDLEIVITSLENAENDNRKFALLLILSELIKSNKLEELKLDKTTPENEKACQTLNERLFNSIGSNFLARLITTKQTTENSSPILFKSVALSIITQFLDYPSLICDPVLLSKINLICDILLLKSDNYPEETIHNLIVDTYKYLYTLSKYCPDYLCQNAGLLELLMEKIILNKSYYNKTESEGNKHFIHNIKNSEENNSNIVIIACKLFNQLCRSENSELIQNLPDSSNEAKKYLDIKNKKVKKCLENLLNSAEQDQTEFKFYLINYLNYFLEEQTTFFESDELNDFSSESIFNILNNLFRSKINRTYKELGFILLNNFVKLYQFEHIYMKNRSFFYLIIHMICIEVSFSLCDSDDVTTTSTNGQFLIFESLSNRMSVLYSLMEEIIVILSTAAPFDDQDEEEESDDEAGDDDKDEEPELKKVIKVIVETLELVMTYVKDSLNLSSVDRMSETDLVLKIASIRLLICWLAHESLLEQELMDLMPEFIKFSEYMIEKKDGKMKVNVFEFLVPGLQRVLIDQEDKLALRNKSLKSVDNIKEEFIDTELKEKIEKSRQMLNKCEVYLR